MYWEPPAKNLSSSSLNSFGEKSEKKAVVIVAGTWENCWDCGQGKG